MSNRVIYYRNKLLSECTREELIAATTWAMERLDQQQKFNAQEREMDKMFRESTGHEEKV